MTKHIKRISYHCYQLHAKCNPTLYFLKFDSIHRRNCWGSSSYKFTTGQMFGFPQILEKNMGIQWNSTSAIYRLQEIPWFS